MITDITVIGAGPVGLSAAFWAGMREASCRIIDSLPELGGQLTALYPEKWIYDVPGHPRILARDLVEQLRVQAVEQFDVPVHLGVTAGRLSYEDDVVVLHTDQGELRSRSVIVAGGHGSFEPRTLADIDLSPWEGRGVNYLVGDKSALRGRRVLVVGGGDSALDWVLNLLDTAAAVELVHRRERFRAHELTLGKVLSAAELGEVTMHVPFQIGEVYGNGSVEGVRLSHSADPRVEVEVGVDAILLALGFKTALGPLAKWGFELRKGAIVVDPLMQTSLDRVWACGDVCAAPGKLKLIATGFAEAAMAVAQAVQMIRPGEPLQPGFSTNTGVPGVVAGQP